MAVKSSKSPEKLGAFKLEPYLGDKDMTKYNYTNIEIESGIEIPSKKGSRSAKINPVLKLLKSMKEGDSIKVENANQHRYIIAIAKKHDVKLTMRTMDNGDFRIWKV